MSISKVEWGQSVFGQNVRLVAGKPALFRADVISSAAAQTAQVRATFSANGSALGTVTLDGPAVVPTSVNPADLTQSYRTVLPANWVAAGLQARLEVDPTNTVAESNEANNTQTLNATVGSGTVLYVTVVPIQQNGTTGSAPANWEQFTGKLWPVKNIDIRTHAAYTSSRVLQNNDANGDWGQLLGEISNLRTIESSQRYYYGFAKVGYSSGVAGIGYVGYPVGMGWDYASSAPGVTAHEIGHNFGLLHAPCGATQGLDTSYPVSNGKLDGWGLDVTALKLYDPSLNYDVMSYCGQNGKQWVSSYMYAKAQTELESSPPGANGAALATSGTVSGPLQPLVLISGRIQNGALELEPLQGFTGRATSPRPGAYTLRLETSAGVFDTPFSANPIAHTDTISFSFSVPNRGAVRAIEIWQGAQRVLRRAAQIRPLSAWTEPSLTENGGRLNLTWDSSAFLSATVTHVALDGERTVIGLRIQRAHSTLDVSTLPAGGYFELTLTDGFNSVQRTVQR